MKPHVRLCFRIALSEPFVIDRSSKLAPNATGSILATDGAGFASCTFHFSRSNIFFKSHTFDAI